MIVALSIEQLGLRASLDIGVINVTMVMDLLA